MSFLEMAQDLQEVIEQIKTEVSYTNIHLVGTCMGGLISSLYLNNNPDKVKSLTLFSPLYTLDQVFLNPQNEFNKQKREVIGMGIQYKMGNAVEGPETIREIKKIRKYFYKKLFAVDIPIYCIQGIEDKLVPAEYQNKIFAIMKEYHEKKYVSRFLCGNCPRSSLFV